MQLKEWIEKVLAGRPYTLSELEYLKVDYPQHSKLLEEFKTTNNEDLLYILLHRVDKESNLCYWINGLEALKESNPEFLGDYAEKMLHYL